MFKISVDDYNTIVKMAKTPISVNVQPDDVKRLLDDSFVVSNSVLGQICAALNSGHHVILSGPPGTGKTTIAQAVALAARGVNPIMTTATADWTTFDTVGGYMPDLSSSSPNALTFETGILLQSMIDRRWIIVDEINRAPIDKAIGQLFSVLSGGDVLLPFRNIKTYNRLKVVSNNSFSSEDTFSRSDDWRMIATMNEYDKNALFDLSYAFMRRFAIIRIGLPDRYDAVVEKWATDATIDTSVVSNIKEITASNMHNREIGPAIFKSIIAYIAERSKMGTNYKLYYAEALSIFLVPQLQGIEEEAIQEITTIAKKCFSGNSDAEKFFADNVFALTGHIVS